MIKPRREAGGLSPRRLRVYGDSIFRLNALLKLHADGHSIFAHLGVIDLICYIIQISKTKHIHYVSPNMNKSFSRSVSCSYKRRKLTLMTQKNTIQKYFTLNDGEENNDDEQEEGVVEDHAPVFQRIALGSIQFVTDAAASS